MEGYYWWVILLNEVLLIHWFTVDNNYIHKLTLSNNSPPYSIYIQYFNDVKLVLIVVYKYAKQKQPVAVKKGTAKQSRINTITEYDW